MSNDVTDELKNTQLYKDCQKEALVWTKNYRLVVNRGVTALDSKSLRERRKDLNVGGK